VKKSLTLFVKEISGAGVGLHEGLRVEDGHVEEGVLIHHTRLVTAGLLVTHRHVCAVRRNVCGGAIATLLVGTQVL
jgi:hypothetical protein